MAFTDSDICNLALSHIGSGIEIQNLETEKSEEAAASRRYLPVCKEIVLREYDWSFARKIEPMQLIRENPNSEWRYEYAYPNECIRFRRILSGLRNDTRQSRVPFKISRGDSQKVIFTDAANAFCEFIFFEKDPTRYPADFVMALSLKLAFYLAPRLTAGDPFKMGERASRLYLYELEKAKASDKNEQQDELEPDAEHIRARN